MKVVKSACQKLYRMIDTIRYDTMIFTCAQKLTYSQLNLPHGTKQKRLMKKLKLTRSPAIAEGPRDAGVPVEIW